jgi:predicted dehydrogenase
MRVVIVGAGMIGAAHLRAARDAGAEVIGVVASTPARSQQVAAEWGVPNGYASLEEALADRPDAVHVCTPNGTHAEYALAAAAAGVHLLLEKPIGMSVAEGEQIVEAVEAAGIVATVPFVYRFHPMVREIRARRLAGELGEILLIHGTYLQDWLASPDASSWRVDPVLGGPSRAFADVGSHWADLAEFVTGERFASVSAAMSIAYPDRPATAGATFGGDSSGSQDRIEVSTEDVAMATFRTERGILANTVISQVSAGRKNRVWIEIDGSKSSAVFDQEHPESAWFGTTRGATIIRRGEGDVAPDQARMSRIAAGHSQGWTDAFAQYVADSYSAMRGEHPEGLPTIQDGLRSLRVVDAVLHSSLSAAWMSLSEPASARLGSA